MDVSGGASVSLMDSPGVALRHLRQPTLGLSALTHKSRLGSVAGGLGINAAGKDCEGNADEREENGGD